MKKRIVRAQVFLVLLWIIQDVFKIFHINIPKLFMWGCLIVIFLIVITYVYNYNKLENGHISIHKFLNLYKIYNIYFVFCSLFYLLSYTAEKRYLDFFDIKSLYDFLLIVSFLVLVRIKKVG